MKRWLVISVFALIIESLIFAQPEIQWQLCVGGSGHDKFYAIQQTLDGGYIAVGITASSDGDISGYHGGGGDFLVVKLTPNGEIEWLKSYGGSGSDCAYSVFQTLDGGYIVAGETGSADGDVVGNHGGSDAWVVKLTPWGEIQWQRCYGGSRDEYVVSIRPTADGGYIMAGRTTSSDGDVSGWHEGYWGPDPNPDVWVVKLNSAGDIRWQRCLGGSWYDYGTSVREAPDGGYVVAGVVASGNGDVSGWHGGHCAGANCGDAWLVKLNSNGEVEWQRCCGGTDRETANSVYPMIGGGYVVVGGAKSSNGDVSEIHGGSDVWMVRLNSFGDILWEKTFGGSGDEDAKSVFRTGDGGFVLVGGTNSTDGDVSGLHPGDPPSTNAADVWVLKVSRDGELRWQLCLGGSLGETGNAVCQTSDGGYILAGLTASEDGDVSGTHEYYDAWVVKLSPDTGATGTRLTSRRISISVLPNPFNSACFISVPEGAAVEIHDVSGRVVFRGIAGKSGMVWYPGTHTPPGLYLVSARLPGGNFGSGSVLYLK